MYLSAYGIKLHSFLGKFFFILSRKIDAEVDLKSVTKSSYTISSKLIEIFFFALFDDLPSAPGR